MKSFNKLLIASTMCFASVGAFSGEVSVGGVTWDETATGGIEGTFVFQQWFNTTSSYGIGSDNQAILIDNDSVAPGNGALAGIGEIDGLNDGRGPVWAPTFCTACELTFAFGGLVPGANNGTGIVFDTTNAWLNIYYDDGNSTAPYGDLGTGTQFPSDVHTQYAEAQNGTLWASFSFDSFLLRGTILGGVVDAELSVTGGIAEVVDALDYFDDIADLKFTGTSIFGSNGNYSSSGNGQLATNVPEPASLALLGLGLLGFGVSRRKKA